MMHTLDDIKEIYRDFFATENLIVRPIYKHGQILDESSLEFNFKGAIHCKFTFSGESSGYGYLMTYKRDSDGVSQEVSYVHINSSTNTLPLEVLLGKIDKIELNSFTSRLFYTIEGYEIIPY